MDISVSQRAEDRWTTLWREAERERLLKQVEGSRARAAGVGTFAGLSVLLRRVAATLTRRAPALAAVPVRRA